MGRRVVQYLILFQTVCICIIEINKYVVNNYIFNLILYFHDRTKQNNDYEIDFEQQTKTI